MTAQIFPSAHGAAKRPSVSSARPCHVSRRLWFATALLLVATVVFPSASAAQPPRADAREHYRKGTAAYNLGRYVEAGEEYERAYEITLDPALLFNVAQAYRLGGDAKKALTAYRSYLRAAPLGDRRALAEAKVRELEGGGERDDVQRAAVPPAVSKVALEIPTTSPEPSEAKASRAPSRLELERRPSDSEPRKPVTHRWSFWAVIAGIAVAGTATAIIVSASGPSTPAAQTTLGTMRF